VTRFEQAPKKFALIERRAATSTEEAKLGALPQPFFPPPHAILEVFVED
jgi:hypothetical protein